LKGAQRETSNNRLLKHSNQFPIDLNETYRLIPKLLRFDVTIEVKHLSKVGQAPSHLPAFCCLVVGFLAPFFPKNRCCAEIAHDKIYLLI
uniref:Uncharacterized protein n=1 Tax=Romanomermis culicivorax TaxID=13658 RepID=A0A915L5E7_ROMCU